MMSALLIERGIFRAGPKWFLLLALITHFGATGTIAADRQSFTYLIVHGAFGGGWDWKTVDGLLTGRGHRVYRPTLTGLGERAHLASPAINLTTHVQDIENLIRYESLSNVVLVGHSYAGMVITGVMDRIPERLKCVIFLDAAIPNDGESLIACFKALDSPLPDAEKPTNGFWTPSFVQFGKPPPSEVPQSWNTFTEPVSFKNPEAKKIPTTCVCFWSKDKKPKDFESSKYFRRVTDRGWRFEELESDHLAERTHPKELASLLSEIPARGMQKRR